MYKALVVVDVQNDFVTGVLGTPEAQAIIPKVCEKIRNFDGDIIVTQDTHYEDYLETREGKFLPVPHCIKYSDGWQIVDEVKAALRDKGPATIQKEAFGSPVLTLYASDYDEMEFIGLCTDICVISNVLLVKNAFPEMDVKVDSACCAGVTPAKHEAALEVMRSCQVEVY